MIKYLFSKKKEKKIKRMTLMYLLSENKIINPTDVNNEIEMFTQTT